MTPDRHLDTEDLAQRLREARQRLATQQRTHPTGRLTHAVRDLVLAILTDHGPLTDIGINDRYQALVKAFEAPAASPGLVRTARLQLVRSGNAEATGERQPTFPGHSAALWRRIERSEQLARQRAELVRSARPIGPDVDQSALARASARASIHARTRPDAANPRRGDRS